jgi:hypothetical protein
MIYHQNICGLRRKIKEQITKFYIRAYCRYFEFFVRYLKHTQKNYTPTENYTSILGTEYCRQLFEGGGLVC